MDEFQAWLKSDMKVTPNKIDLDIANQIYDILKSCCGAQEHGRHNFLVVQTEPNKICNEYRFCGSLGFGGKFWNRRNGDWNVTYYQEDETPERHEMLVQANLHLEECFLRTSLKRMKAKQWWSDYEMYVTDQLLIDRLEVDYDVEALKRAFGRDLVTKNHVAQCFNEGNNDITICGMIVAIRGQVSKAFWSQFMTPRLEKLNSRYGLFC